jgi:hypothetical protein
MNQFRRSLSCAGLAAAAASILLCAVAARPQQPLPQQPQTQPTPRIAFIPGGPLNLKPSDTPTETLLQNNTAEPVEVTIEIIDADPKGEHKVTEVLKFAPQTVTLEPARSMMIKLNPLPETVKQFGRGFLVAVEKGKTYARREIEAREPPPPQPAGTPTQPVKEPPPVDSVPTANLPGINFVPSLISRDSALVSLLLLLVLPLLGAWVLRSSRPKSALVRLLVATLVVTLAAVLSGMAVGGQDLGRNLFSWVEVSPLPMAAPQKFTGGLISADGSVGELRGDGQQLRVTHIPRAGTYDGLLKVGEGLTAKDLKVVANVSDWWPYAFIAISLGVLLGYYLTRYFKQQRGEDEQAARAAQLWLRVSDEESQFQLAHGGTPYAGYSIALAARRWLDGAENSIARHDAAAAKASLDRLEAYLSSFAQFHDKVLALDKIQAEVWELIRKAEPALGQDRNLVPVFRAAAEAFEGRPLNPSADEEQPGAELKGLQTSVQAVLDWLHTLERAIGAINSNHRAATRLTDDAATLKKFENARRAAIMASQKDDVVAAQGLADAAYGALLAEAGGGNNLEAGLAGAGAAFKALRPLDVAVTELEDQSGAARDPDDLHVFTAKVILPPNLEPPRLWWDFGDGTTSEIPPSALAHGGAATIRVSHRYSKGGSYKLAIKKSTGNAITERLDVVVDTGPGRAARLLAAFRYAEWQMSVIAGLIAVGLGFYTLYLSKAVWGTPADYLYAVLWGSVVSEGLKYATSIVERAWAR